MTSGSMPEGTPEADPDLLPEGYEWLTREQVRALDGVSERTITSRISSGYYKSKLTEEGKRLIAYKQKVAGSDPEVNIPPAGSLPEPPPESSGSVAGSDAADLRKLMHMVLEAGENNRKLTERLLESESGRLQAEAEVEKKKAELTIMNNERASSNTALQKAADDRRDNNYLRGEVETLRAENEALKKQLAAKPKWQFW